MSSSSSRVLFYTMCEDFYHDQPPHLLDCCFLCHNSLEPNNDIFMFRWNTPFYSDDCRQEQIKIDKAKERPWNLSATFRKLRKADKSTKSGSEIIVRTGTVVAG